MSITLQPGEIKRVDVVMTPLTTGWLSPVSSHDPDRVWQSEKYAYDGNPNTFAWTDTPGGRLRLDTAGIAPLVSKVRLFCGTAIDSEYQDADITVLVYDYDDDLDIQIFSGIIPALQWVEIPLDKVRAVYDITVKWNDFHGGGYGDLYELQYWSA